VTGEQSAVLLGRSCRGAGKTPKVTDAAPSAHTWTMPAGVNTSRGLWLPLRIEPTT
jgi:hypothetical protein